MTRHLPVRTPSRAPSVPAAERRQQDHARALAECTRGYHAMTNTFRTSERVCTVCGLVTYCPTCLDAAHLPRSQAARAYAVECMQHLRHQRGGQS